MLSCQPVSVLLGVCLVLEGIPRKLLNSSSLPKLRLVKLPYLRKHQIDEGGHDKQISQTIYSTASIICCTQANPVFSTRKVSNKSGTRGTALAEVTGVGPSIHPGLMKRAQTKLRRAGEMTLFQLQGFSPKSLYTSQLTRCVVG